MLKYRIGIAMLTTLLIIACQKEEFTQPVGVDMEVAFADDSSDYLSFEMGHILYEQILFDGQRQQGGAVHFATEPDKEIGPITFEYGSSAFVKRFDLPQGIYTNMQWHFELEEIELFDGDDDELEDDDENDEDSLEGGLLITGYYSTADAEQIPLYIVIDDDEKLLAATMTESGYQDIVLTSDKHYSAILMIDPYYATRLISAQSFANAEISNNDTSDYIVISEDKNEDLYEVILYRLESSLKVLIK